MLNKPKHTFFLLLILIATIVVDKLLEATAVSGQIPSSDLSESTTIPAKVIEKIGITKDVRIATYFEFIDSLVAKYDSLVRYELTPHLLVRANSWIIDSLVSTDYYYRKAKGTLVYDQRQLVVLHKGDSISIPGNKEAEVLREQMCNTRIDINIPEFKLRIYQDKELLFEFPVSVGRNEKRFLTTTNELSDLRTTSGKGTVVGHLINLDFYDSVADKRDQVTTRADGKISLIPHIPSIEMEIDDRQNGLLIYATTSPSTLGKAAANGDIGTREGDFWIIYYYSPIGTLVNIRYDLHPSEGSDNGLLFKDIYDHSLASEERD